METLFGKVTVYRAAMRLSGKDAGRIFKLGSDKTDKGWPSLVIIRQHDQDMGDCLMAFSLYNPRSAASILKKAYRDWMSGTTVFDRGVVYEITEKI